MYYFKEGFCWTNVLTTYIKCRLKEKTVHSTESMSFFSETINVPEYFIITLMNSQLIAYYVDSFVNSTSHCTTGDAKLIPIVIPNYAQLNTIKCIYDEAVKIRMNTLPCQECEKLLNIIQKRVDEYVLELYGI